MTNEFRRLEPMIQLGNFLPNNNWERPTTDGLVRSTDPDLFFKTYGPIVDRIIFLVGILIGSAIQWVISSLFYIIHLIEVLGNVFSLFLVTEGFSMLDKVSNIFFNIGRIIFIQFVALFIFEYICIFGLFAPNNAKKMYTAVENLTYGRPLLGRIFDANEV
jgi:hypothetical protein